MTVGSRSPIKSTRRVRFDLVQNQVWEFVQRSPSVSSAGSDISYDSDEDWALNPDDPAPVEQ